MLSSSYVIKASTKLNEIKMKLSAKKYNKRLDIYTKVCINTMMVSTLLFLSSVPFIPKSYDLLIMAIVSFWLFSCLMVMSLFCFEERQEERTSYNWNSNKYKS